MSKKYFNSKDDILKIENEYWTRVGTVMSLHIQPLLSGRTVVAKDYCCKDIGLTASLEDATVRNSMIVIYDAKDNCIKEKELYHKLQNLIVRNLNDFEICLEAFEMNELIVNILNLVVQKEPIVCKASFCERYLVEMNCFDCGEQAAKWINKYLQTEDLRLAYVSAEPEYNQFWHKLQKSCESEPDDRNVVIPHTCTPRYRLLSYQSLTELNRTSGCHLTLEEFNPDICIMPNSMFPFAEFEWDTILVGEAIMQNIKPWDRSKLDPMKMPTDMKINMLLLHCELHTPGNVQVGDGVYVFRKRPIKLGLRE